MTAVANDTDLLIIDADMHISEPWDLWTRHAPARYKDRVLIPAIQYLGEDNCLFETDFPHPTCLCPDPVERALTTLQDASPDLKRKLLGGDAARIYHLPLPEPAP